MSNTRQMEQAIKNIAVRGTSAARGEFMALVFRAVIRPCEDVGGFFGECPMENGGCTVQGDTIQETQKLMLESVDFYLEDYPEIKNYCVEFEYKNA